MTTELEITDTLTEREDLITRLQRAYGFSECEAMDYIDFCAVDKVVQSPAIAENT